MVDDPCCFVGFWSFICLVCFGPILRIVFEGVGFLRNFDPAREEGIVGLQWFEIWDFAAVGLVLLLLSSVGWE